MQKNDIVIICNQQFGYHIDTYQYCKYLKEKYSFYYICKNEGKPIISANSIKVIYLNNTKSLPFAINTLKILFKIRGNLILFIKWFPFCSILQLFRKNSKKILDIRSSAITHNIFIRNLKNLILMMDSMFFQNKSFISKGLMEKYRVFKFGTSHHLLPLGANISNLNPTAFNNSIKMVYVGTFQNRNLEKSIGGVCKFKNRNQNIDIEYVIFGNGSNKTIRSLKKLIDRNNSNGFIKLNGYLKHEELYKVLSGFNIGLAFIPQTKYFDVQPPTKTYEYIAAGLITVATNTQANKEIIKDGINGILIEDSCEGVYEGLQRITKRQFDPFIIKSTIGVNTWEEISKQFEKIILSIVKENIPCI